MLQACRTCCTGDLNIIRDASLRSLIEKGPTYREQNYINWSINEKICSSAVAEYKHKWSLKEGIDTRALNEWENMVNECINRRIRSLKGKHINRRKHHVLKSRKHLNYLQELHSKYVLVPADKAVNNVIVVCKKYYLEVVLREITTTDTYEYVEEYTSVVTEHMSFIASENITVQPELRQLPSFYWLPKLQKNNIWYKIHCCI